jgi:hypothetical protein
MVSADGWMGAGLANGCCEEPPGTHPVRKINSKQRTAVKRIIE